MALADALPPRRLVRRVRVRVQEADRDRLHAVRGEDVGLAVDGVQVEPREDRPSAASRSGHLAAEVPRHEWLRPTVRRVVDLGPVAPADREHVPEAGGREQADSRAALLQHGVDGDGRPVEQLVDVGERHPSRARPARSSSTSRSGVEGCFSIVTVPVVSSRSTKSMNVPPTSTATRVPRSSQ